LQLIRSLGSFFSQEFGLIEARGAAWTTGPWGLLTGELHWQGNCCPGQHQEMGRWHVTAGCWALWLWSGAAGREGKREGLFLWEFSRFFSFKISV